MIAILAGKCQDHFDTSTKFRNPTLSALL